MLNKVQLIGRLGNDPDIRHTQDGKTIATLSIATCIHWKDKQTGEKKEKTEWHRVVMFNRLAEIAGQYLRKGSQVYVEGRIRTRKWQDKSGHDRYTTVIAANEMQMLGSRDSGNQETGQQPQQSQAEPPQSDYFEDDTIPF